MKIYSFPFFHRNKVEITNRFTSDKRAYLPHIAIKSSVKEIKIGDHKPVTFVIFLDFI